MSYIDTFDHEFVGWFGHRPVYHPLVTVHTESKERPQDFSCDPTHLVIGGGSGEHKAIVIKRLDSAVAHFYLYVSLWLHELEDKKKKKPFELDFDKWNNIFNPYYLKQHEMLHFAGWGVEDYVEFATEAKSMAYHLPHKDEDGSIEIWIMESIGEFVLFSMPEIVPHLSMEMEHLRHIIGVTIPFQNLRIPPPGYPLIAGRKIVDGKLQWGNHRWHNT